MFLSSTNQHSQQSQGWNQTCSSHTRQSFLESSSVLSCPTLPSHLQAQHWIQSQLGLMSSLGPHSPFIPSQSQAQFWLCRVCTRYSLLTSVFDLLSLLFSQKYIWNIELSKPKTKNITRQPPCTNANDSSWGPDLPRFGQLPIALF